MNNENRLLYKYRDLKNFKKFVDIILKSRLYAASYKDLNDPMEGQYYHNRGILDEDMINKLKGEKGLLKICSLSRKKNDPLMWSHYGDGHKGVVIGVELTGLNEQKKIEYKGIPFIKEIIDQQQSAMEILSYKSPYWKYEAEERIFTRTGKFINIKVHEVITGRKMNDDDHLFIEDLIKKINPEINVKKALII